MIQTIKNYIRNFVAASLLLVPLLVPATVAAQDTPADGTNQITTGLCGGVQLSTGANDCTDDTTAEGKVNGLIKLIINIFSIVVGVVSVIMIIVGGLKYITSAGDSNNVTSAKNTILYAIIGLVVVALAQFIVQFVLNKALNADTTDTGLLRIV